MLYNVIPAGVGERTYLLVGSVGAGASKRRERGRSGWRDTEREGGMERGREGGGRWGRRWWLHPRSRCNARGRRPASALPTPAPMPRRCTVAAVSPSKRGALDSARLGHLLSRRSPPSGRRRLRVCDSDWLAEARGRRSPCQAPNYAYRPPGRTTGINSATGVSGRLSRVRVEYRYALVEYESRSRPRSR